MTVLEFLRSQEHPPFINRRGLLSIRPVVVDTSALVSDVYWHLNTQASQVLATAELGSVRLFAPTTVYHEVYEKLSKLASGKNAGRLEEALQLWEERYLPLIRWCHVDWRSSKNPVVAAVSDVSDRPLAAIATTIAPCHVWSDNYKHLAGVGVAPPNTAESWRSQAQASGSIAGATGITVVSSIPVIATVAGVKEGITFLARRPRLGVGVGLLALTGIGVGAYRLRGTRVQHFKERIGGSLSALAEAVGPVIEAYKGGQELLRNSELVAGDPKDWSALVAHTLAVSPRPLLMREIVEAVGYTTSHELTVRELGRILRSSQIFERLANGRWEVGYIAVARPKSQAAGITVTTS